MKTAQKLAVLMMAWMVLPAVVRATDERPLVHEGPIPAPLDQVWAAFTTKAGLESWMAFRAEIDLRIGGKMRTRYDSNGTVDDATAIENTILSFEPKRMISFRVTRAPQGFPFPNAITNMWTVVYFEAQGEKATQVREVSMGFGTDEESRKMREFFNRGNAITLEELRKHFTAAPATK